MSDPWGGTPQPDSRMQPTSLGTTRQTLIKSSSAFSHKHLASVDEMSQWNLSGPYCGPLLLHLLERAFSFYKTLHCSSTSPPLCYRVLKQAHTYHWSFRNATMWWTQRTYERAHAEMFWQKSWHSRGGAVIVIPRRQTFAGFHCGSCSDSGCCSWGLNVYME